MAQTKLGSIAEAWANIAVGFTINYCANLVILPLFGFHSLTARNNFIQRTEVRSRHATGGRLI